MKRNKRHGTLLSVILALFVFVIPEISSASVGRMAKRCEEDSLNPTQAIGRIQWMKKCGPEYLVRFWDQMYGPEPDYSNADKIDDLEFEWTHNYRTGKPLTKPQYPTLTKSNCTNPLNWKAGISETEECRAIPTDYLIVATCRSSCYHPETFLLFEEGEVLIKEALESKLDQIMTVREGSTLSSIFLTPKPVDHYTISLTDTQHKLVVLTMESGAELKITTNHPLVNQDGIMVEANSLQEGDALIRRDGFKDIIAEKEMVDYFGKVYNVAPATESLKSNIVIAEGYLAGSDWYQNEGYDNINKVIMRASIPDEIVEWLGLWF